VFLTEFTSPYNLTVRQKPILAKGLIEIKGLIVTKELEII